MSYFRLLSKLWQNLITGWALVGGFILIIIVCINVFSIIGGIFLIPLQGDFELTQMGIAVAVFAFFHTVSSISTIFLLKSSLHGRILKLSYCSALSPPLWLFYFLYFWSGACMKV